MNKLFPTIILVYTAMIVYTLYNQQQEFNKTMVVSPLELEYKKLPNRIWGVDYTEDDKNCMALNIYFEARGEPIQGQYAVAEVVMHRVKHARYPDTICDVIKEARYYSWNNDIIIKHQCHFSWYCDGKKDRPMNGHAFEIAMNIAEEVLTNPSYKNKIDYALFYHAGDVKPYWSNDMEMVAQIGNHYFY